MLSEKLRSFSMQDLTLIRDEDALPLQGPDGRLDPALAASWTPLRT